MLTVTAKPSSPLSPGHDWYFCDTPLTYTLRYFQGVNPSDTRRDGRPNQTIAAITGERHRCISKVGWRPFLNSVLWNTGIVTVLCDGENGGRGFI